MSVIDEVKQRTDIVEVIGQYASLKKAGRNLIALCPFHSEKHPSFFVYPEQQSWHCFGACNTGGDVLSFVMKKEDIDFGEALRLLAQRAGVTIPSRIEREDSKEENEALYQANEAASQYFHNLLLNSSAGEKARSYVANRRFSPQTITDFQLGFSPDGWEALKQYLVERSYSEDFLLTAGLLVKADDGKTHDRFRGRLMFPIRDGKGRTTGFGARALDDSQPKYLNSPQTPIFDKSGTLYGIDLAVKAIRQQDMAVIVEGYIDVITAHQNGLTNVVASMGTSVTEKQVSMLKRLSRNPVLALDADAAGEEAMLRGVSYENTLDAEIRVIILPQGKDPDDVIKEDAEIWRQLLEKALPIVDYAFDMVTSKLDLNTARDKSLAVDRLAPIVTEIKNPVRQAHYLQKLARLVRMSEHHLEAALSQMRPAPGRQKVQRIKQERIARVRRPIFSNSLEEYCLALLLQHPELKNNGADLLPEYFENSENREIFTAWKQAGDLTSIREKLDTTVHGHLDFLINKSLPPSQLEQRFVNSVLRLREAFLRNLEAKRADIFALEADSGGTGADLVRLEEQGIEPSIKLKEVFSQKKSGLARAKEANNEQR
ncbi:DNA primase [Chloroflexota bacterium]